MVASTEFATATGKHTDLIRVLFVDDEPHVLHGLRRMLRSERDHWDMSFSTSGETALAAMQVQPFDVIVSDMRMPEMDGGELLHRIAELYPNTIRLVLSGQSEQQRVMRAVGPAHQFLSKPCDASLLIQTIRQACELRDRLGDVHLKSLVSKIQTLPSLPIIYDELVRLLQSGTASLQMVSELIQKDVGMTTKILKLVNSSFFGFAQHISDVHQAVTLLGLGLIEPLVLTAGVFSQYEDPGMPEFSLDAFMQHATSVASTARTIAEHESDDKTLIDDAFLAGMLHDLGKLILATELPGVFLEAMERSSAECIPMWQVEKSLLGTTHAELGAHLIGLWGLPNTVVDAVAHHHLPSQAATPGFSPLAAVHAANVLQHATTPHAGVSPVFDWDEAYLVSTGLSGRRDTWRELFNNEVR